MNEFQLYFRNLHPTRYLDTRALRSLVPELLTQMGVNRAEICWLFVGKTKMARDNMKYLGHQGSTDVITLQYRQPACPEDLFGDVLICLDEAELYAAEFKTTTQSEALRYLVHSILHLQGFDDIDPEDRRIMKRHENRWLKWVEEQLGGRVLLLERKNTPAASDK